MAFVDLDAQLAIASAGTVVVAVLGLKRWSRQLRGTADFEVDRKLAKSRVPVHVIKLSNCMKTAAKRLIPALATLHSPSA